MVHRSNRLATWSAILPLLLGGCSLDLNTPDPFEDYQEQGNRALDWVNTSAHAVSFEPSASTTDLQPLKKVVGTARLVGMGEATHGTHEFFTMKDRVFRFLVEEMGFTGFAIEATMPEAFAVDTYVRTGRGDPAVLLSHLYFWTWNTSEVADLIQWMRAYNRDKPADKQVGFYGFDMQYPGVAIDSVVSYTTRVAPGLAFEIAQDYACLNDYRNDTRGRSPQNYSSAPPDVLVNCGAAVVQAHERLVARRNVLEPVSSAADYALALQMARVVVQWEATKRNQMSRDAAMAENADWLLRNRAGPNGKLFLWAHNFHISRGPQGNTMGAYLARTFREAYVPIGFTFGSGDFTAVVNGSVSSTSAPEPSIGSYEEVFQYAKKRNFLVAMAELPTGDLAAWFAGPKRMRTIGSVYNPAQPESFYYTAYPRAEFDALIYVHSTTASRRLPFIF